jgi:hypothetical protein
MSNPMRQQDGGSTLEQVHELIGYHLSGVAEHADLEGILRKYRGAANDTSYPARFRRTIDACTCNTHSSELTVDTFPENVFGTLSEDGGTLAQPPISRKARKRGYWLDSEIDEWFAGADVKDKGLESCYLVDLAKYGEDHPEEQRTKAIVCWRAGKNGCVAALVGDGSERHFGVGVRADGWLFDCWFLLRKVLQPAAL